MAQVLWSHPQGNYNTGYRIFSDKLYIGTLVVAHMPWNSIRVNSDKTNQGNISILVHNRKCILMNKSMLRNIKICWLYVGVVKFSNLITYFYGYKVFFFPYMKFFFHLWSVFLFSIKYVSLYVCKHGKIGFSG